MGRSIGILAVVGFLLLGCGFDTDKLTSDARGRSTTTSTGSTPASPPATTEPSGRSTSADDLLLDVADLGTGWTEGGGSSSGLQVPTCADATSGPQPADEAHAVFVHGVLGAVVLQTVSVYASEEQAQQAVTGFRAGLDACSNAAIDVQDLSLPPAGDQLEAARLKLGASVAGATVDIACVRVGRATSRLASISLREAGSEQFATVVKKAADKLP